ncbi:hypothetical protein HF086_010446 [Spodoptera exigua]|uniref:Uncharacterized protein n=1 Tax=Spodoptera exigua TaxID=7107 RepID=A0A922MTT7_SPOEX|nr:hypothetical protein HF086_010446 [Spodoptera exigua]
MHNCRPRSLGVHTMAHGSLLPGKPLAMDVEVITAAAIYLYTVYKYYRSVYRHKVIKKKWRKRRWWMLTIHRNRTRQFMDNLLGDLVAEPSGEFDNFVRMSSSDFEYILQKNRQLLQKGYILARSNTSKNKIGIDIAISCDWRQL